MRRLRAVLANAALALAAVVFVLGVFEIAFRVLMRGRGGAEDGAADRYVEFDERLGWRKKPGAHVQIGRS